MPLDAHGHGGDHHDWKKKVELWMVMKVMIIPLDGHGGDDHNWKKR